MSAPEKPLKPARALTIAEVRRELERVRIRPNSRLRKTIEWHAETAEMDADDLLHEVMARTLSTRKIPRRLAVKTAIPKIAWSIASDAAKSRKRKRNDARNNAGDTINEVPTPADVLERERMRTTCIALLDRLTNGEPTMERLVDGIGSGLRGKHLADAVGVTEAELATLRRALKRDAARLQSEYEAARMVDDTPRSRLVRDILWR
jgi:hypothetical protein